MRGPLEWWLVRAYFALLHGHTDRANRCIPLHDRGLALELSSFAAAGISHPASATGAAVASAYASFTAIAAAINAFAAVPSHAAFTTAISAHQACPAFSSS